MECSEPARASRPARQALSEPRPHRGGASRAHRQPAAASRGGGGGHRRSAGGVVIEAGRASGRPARRQRQAQGDAMKDRDDNPCRPRHFKPAPCAPAALDGPVKESLETSHTRLIIAGALFCLAFLVIGARLVEVAGFKAGDTRIAHWHGVEQPQVSRADIVDRNGVLLATNLISPSLYANPKQIQDPRGVARAL